MIKKIINGFFILISLFVAILPVNAIGSNGPSWTKNTLSVYIPSDNNLSSTMLHAFQRWQNKCYGQLKFIYVLNPPADIEVVFAQETDGSDGEIGSYALTIKGGDIAGAEITIANSENKHSKDLVFTTMLHEVGHALGLTDTNRNIGIMHSPVNEKQDIVSNDIIKLFRLNGWSYMNKGTYNIKLNAER